MSTKHSVVSMLAGDQKITLFTVSGQMVDIRHGEDYDTGAIMAYLKSKVTGLAPVEIDLAGYLSKKQTDIAKTLADGGIEVTQVINGVEVQGIFYPKKPEVSVKIAGKETVVPGLENLARHAKHANKHNPQAIQAFLNRMAPVLKERQHSSEDLMNFIGNSEMPLTNDGRIICYKRLSKHPSIKGMFVDGHSHKVTQRVGSRVFMKSELVDPSRYNSCSNGLHVANQSYMGGFSAEATFIVLVNPEDFIAVPEGENGKARVCAYEIIGQMTADAHAEVSKGYVKDDAALKHLIAQAIEGNHVKPFENVEADKKGLVGVTPIEGRREVTKSNAPVTAEAKAAAVSLDATQPKTEEPEDLPTTDVTGVLAGMTKEAVKLPDEVLTAFKAIRDGLSKSAAGKAAGTSDRTVGRWMDKYDYAAWLTASVTPPVAGNLHDEPTQEELETTAEMAPAIVGRLAAPKEEAKDHSKAFVLYNLWKNLGTQAAWEALIEFKRNAKKGWSQLGITAEQIEDIMSHMANKDKLAKALEAGKFDFYVNLDRTKIVTLIKETREFLKIGLKEAKDLVESGKPLLDNAEAGEVARFNKILMEAGFVTEIVHHGEARKPMPKVEVKSSLNTPTAPLSKSQQARLLFEAKDWKALIQFKKAAKKGWDILGFNDKEIGQIKKATE